MPESAQSRANHPPETPLDLTADEIIMLETAKRQQTVPAYYVHVLLRKLLDLRDKEKR